jgi:hypothetical protein
MQQRTGLIRIIAGLLFTLLGVGGVENSLTTPELLASIAVSGLGLAFMFWATVDINRQTNQTLQNLRKY